MNLIFFLNCILTFFTAPAENNAIGITINYTSSHNSLYNLADNAVVNNYKYSDGITSTLLHNFNLKSENNTVSIYKTFFTEKNNCILFTKNKQQSNSNSEDTAETKYFNTIIYIDRYRKAITTLLKIDTDIKSISFNQPKKIISFITNNRALGYKLSDDNQLTEIYRSSEDFKLIDASLNYDATLLAVAYELNKLAILKIIDNQNISLKSEHVYLLAIKKIVSIKFSPTDPILAIENTNNIKTSIILFELTKDNKLGLPLYNIPSYKHIIKYAITPIEKQLVLQQNIDSANNSNKYLHIIGEKNHIDYYHNPLSRADLNFNNNQMSSVNVVDFVVCENKDKIIAIKKSSSDETTLYFISVYQDQYNFQIVTKEINGKNYNEALLDSFYPYNLQYQKFQEIFKEANSIAVNKDSSEIAVIGNNKIQIYNIKYVMISTIRSDLSKIFSKYYIILKLFYLRIRGYLEF